MKHLLQILTKFWYHYISITLSLWCESQPGVYSSVTNVSRLVTITSEHMMQLLDLCPNVNSVIVQYSSKTDVKFQKQNHDMMDIRDNHFASYVCLDIIRLPLTNMHSLCLPQQGDWETR